MDLSDLMHELITSSDYIAVKSTSNQITGDGKYKLFWTISLHEKQPLFRERIFCVLMCARRFGVVIPDDVWTEHVFRNWYSLIHISTYIINPKIGQNINGEGLRRTHEIIIREQSSWGVYRNIHTYQNIFIPNNHIIASGIQCPYEIIWAIARTPGYSVSAGIDLYIYGSYNLWMSDRPPVVYILKSHANTTGVV